MTRSASGNPPAIPAVFPTPEALCSRTRWIWCATPSENQYVWLRRNFKVDSLPTVAFLRITATDRYVCWINDRYLGQGATPHRAPWHTLDRHDIRHLLQSGNNCLAIVGHSIGRATHTSTPEPPGILVELHLTFSDGSTQVIVSDKNWKAQIAAPWKSTNRRRSWATGFAEDFDATLDIPGWRSPDFHDESWPGATAHGLQKAKFVARPAPLLEETFLPARQLLNVWTAGTTPQPPEGVSATKRLDNEPLAPASAGLTRNIKAALKDNHPFTIPADPTHALALTFDLEQEWSGQIEFVIDAPAGCLIEGVGAERLIDGRARASFKGADYAFRYTTRAGIQHWRESNYNGLRYLHLVFRQRTGPIHVKKIGLVRQEAALDYNTRFHSSKAQWNRLHAVSLHTLRISSQDVQVDCPTREQAPYVGDGIWTGLWTAWLTGNPCYLRHLLFSARTCQQPNGLITGCPLTGLGASHTMFDYSLLHIWGYWMLYFYTGNRADAADGIASSERLLAWFLQRMNDDGLLRLDVVKSQAEKQGLLFLDHNGLGWHIPNEPGIDRGGANAGLHFLLVQAMDYYLKLCRAARRAPSLPINAALLRRLRASYRKQFWDAKSRLFADARHGDVLSESLSEQTQTLAVLAGIVSPTEGRPLLERVLAFRRKPIARCTPYFMIYLAEAMLLCGLREEAIHLAVKRWKPMLDAGATTWWETFAGDDLDSFCHPWSSLPLWLSFRAVLGINPTAPGWRRVEVSPCRTIFPKAQGRIVTSRGELDIDWSPGKRLNIDAPPSCSVVR